MWLPHAVYRILVSLTSLAVVQRQNQEEKNNNKYSRHGDDEDTQHTQANIDLDLYQLI